MSHSPESNEVGHEELQSYQRRWAATYKLIDEGKSWSGNERNCAFLNARGERFVDISAACGLDFKDDGRAVAVADWDFDGRLDFWVTNRTAPRARFLHNQGGRTDRYVAILLEGTTCNPDAIGARLELTTNGGKQIRTVRAGDGYLAQSSKWVHFGLGAADTIEELVVRWPGGATEHLEGLEPGRHYRVVQGTGRAQPWQPPAPGGDLVESPAEIPRRPTETRTWVAGRVLFPGRAYLDWEGRSQPLAAFVGEPLLINLWSRHCQPCLSELRDWKDHAGEIRQSGLRVLALSVDQEPDGKVTSGLPFASGIASEEVIEGFETVHRALLETRQPLPVPCSVLLDARGHVAAIYKGRLEVDQLVSDAALLGASSEDQRRAALPFSGRWHSSPLPPMPRQVIGTLMEAGKKEAARDYTARCLDPESGLSLPPATQASLVLFFGDLHLDEGELDRAVEVYRQLFEVAPRDAALHREVGMRLVAKQRVKDAIRHLERAVDLDPAHLDSRLNLATLQMREGLLSEATAHFRELTERVPDSAPLHFYLGNALQRQGMTAEALDHYGAAHRLQPQSAASNNLAWILATSRDDSLRNGKRAVELAEEACRVRAFKEPALLNTLAAAYAESGRFEAAVAIAEKALDLARSDGAVPSLIKQISQNLSLLRAGRPIRE